MHDIILIALMLSASCAIILTVFATRRHRKRSREEKLLLRFSQVGTENNLSFTSQELLYNSIIGLDGLKRKLLFLQETNGIYHPLIIDLNTVNHCAVILKYRGFRLARNRNAGVYFEKLSLRFQTNDNQLIETPFYAYPGIKLSVRRQLEQRARHWQTILSKMIAKKQPINAHKELWQMR
jgi:hypothetical protein